MVSVRFRSLANTLLVVTGALLIGQALHLTVVTGREELLAPGPVGLTGLGVALVVSGWIVHNPVGEARDRYRRREADAGTGTETGAEGGSDAFDSERSPIGEAPESSPVGDDPEEKRQ